MEVPAISTSACSHADFRLHPASPSPFFGPDRKTLPRGGKYELIRAFCWRRVAPPVVDAVMATNVSCPFVCRFRDRHAAPRARFPRRLAMLASAMLLLTGTSKAAPSDFTFIHIGILPGGLTSEVYAVDNDVTLAACSTLHVEEAEPRDYGRRNAARWTPAEGLKALPLLPYSEAVLGGSGPMWVGGTDVTPDGTKLLFTSHTTPEDGAAAAFCNADGSNVVVLTNLPGGEKMHTASDISDDGKTVFGLMRTLSYFDSRASRWTEASGFELLPLPNGYSGSRHGSASADGTVSTGTWAAFDADGNHTAQQAYRWTKGGSAKGIGYLAGDDRSYASDISADGSTILGGSYNSETYYLPSRNIFIWTQAGGMKNLSRPPLHHYNNYGDGYFWWGSGISGDGKVVALAYYQFAAAGCSGSEPCDPEFAAVSFVVNPEYRYHAELTSLIKQAGGGAAIEGWGNFNINGITDDGNTVYGYAINPQGQQEGFIARFPAGFLHKLKSPERLLNISTRLQVGSGEQVSIAGFIVTGEVPKKVIVRGLGPSLAAEGVQNVIADPVLQLHKPDGTVFTNDQWKSTQRTQINATGIPPAHDDEAAIVATLAPGVYTAELSNKSGTAGIGLVEVYDLNAAVDSKLANISTRGFVGTAEEAAMIGGFIVGREETSLLIRAIGPSLASEGVTGAISDPRLDIYDTNGNLWESNDNWKAQGEYPERVERIKKTGVAPTDEREAAVMFGSSQANWTAIVRGKGGETGVALVEVYDLGP